MINSLKNNIKNYENKIELQNNDTFDLFDWESYINNYEDLRKANIDTKEKAWNHWIQNGEREGRTFCNIEKFNWESYINNYEDLRKANIDTKEKAWQHWIKHGKKEGRTFESI
jgi:1,4-dihydroxy-2-naphthoate octaprenyltransferase